MVRRTSCRDADHAEPHRGDRTTGKRFGHHAELASSSLGEGPSVATLPPKLETDPHARVERDLKREALGRLAPWPS
jgi:hypothetical protein